jgi:TRAP-type C4-dicarboxylate transport system substrate-binding protein
MITPWEERKVGYFELLDEAHKKIGIKLLGRVATESGFYIFSKNKIGKIDDFKEIKIRSHSGYDPFFKAMGAVPVHMKISEIYTGLERGLVEAAPYPLFVYDMGVSEVTKYVLDEPFWSSHTTMTFMNLKKFQSLSEEMQNLLLKTAEQLERDMVPVIEDLKANEKKRLKSGGMEFIKLSSEESEKFRRLAIEERMKAIENQGRVTPETIEKIKVMIWR